MEKKILFAFLIFAFACNRSDKKVSPTIVDSSCDKHCYYINASDYSSLEEALEASDSLRIPIIVAKGHWKPKKGKYVKDNDADLKDSSPSNGIIINDNHGRIEIK